MFKCNFELQLSPPEKSAKLFEMGLIQIPTYPVNPGEAMPSHVHQEAGKLFKIQEALSFHNECQLIRLMNWYQLPLL